MHTKIANSKAERSRSSKRESLVFSVISVVFVFHQKEKKTLTLHKNFNYVLACVRRESFFVFVFKSICIKSTTI